MQLVFEALIQNGTQELVNIQLENMQQISKMDFRVNLKVVRTLDGYKAILEANGFLQVIEIYLFETFSSVIKPTTIRVVLTLVVSKGWKLR